MLPSTKSLPEGYYQTYEINLAKDKGLAFLLNVAGLILFILTIALLILLLRWIRPGVSIEVIPPKVSFYTMLGLSGLVLLTIFSLYLHELIHGFFSWVFTRSKPAYGVRLAYAYAAAPDWFIPIRQYWIIGMAPLVILDIIGLLFIFVAPATWLLIIAFLTALNTGGAVGDLCIIGHLFRVSPACLVKDMGDGVCFFELGASTTDSTKE